MAIPSVGGGYQVGDGNSNERQLNTQPAPQTATVTATLTAAQILGGILVGSTSTTAASYTLPTVALTEAALGNASNVNQTFDLNIINLGTGTAIITVLVGTGWTLVGMATLPITTSAGSSAHFRARKTGDSAWTLYRVA